MLQISTREKSTFWIALIAIGLLLIVIITAGNLFSFTPSAEQSALTSLEKITPVRFKLNDAGHVIELTATDSTMNDAAAIYLNALPELERLHLEKSGISDAALQHIATLKKLQSLFLDQTAVTDQGLQQLKQSDQLQQLSLVECQIGDAGLAAIGNMADLIVLNLSQTDVTDAGLKHLTSLSELKSLYVSQTNLTGTGLQSLGEKPKLTLLDLNGTDADETLVAALNQFPGLEMLFLGNSRITDEQIPALMAVLKDKTPKLRGLSLKENPLTDSSITDLQQLKDFNNLALVQLQDTRITKPAFKQLASVVTEVNFSVDYSERDE